MSSFPHKRLGEVTSNFDSKRVPVKKTDRKPGPFPYYGASGIADYVDSYIFDGEYLLISEDGENLKTQSAPIAFLACGKFWVNNHAHVVQGNELADTRFLCYALQSTDIRPYLSGSTRPKLTKSDLNRIQVPCPDLVEQKQIVRLLQSFDDKIELNRQMNATLEEMARALFKSWFVDFDPVHAKARGAAPVGMDPTTAALFPDSFEEVDGRWVPAGWEVVELKQVLEVLETGSRPKGGVKGITSGVPSIGAESIVGLGIFDYGKTKYVPYDFYAQLNRGRVVDRDVLLYKDGGRPGMFEPHVTIFGDGFPFKEFCINSHVYRMRVRAGLSQEYLYLWMDSDWAMQEMKNRATGVAIPGINSTAVKRIPILLPDEEVQKAFHRIVQPYFDLVLANCNEMRTLSELRDTLLPRLMSGQLRVP